MESDSKKRCGRGRPQAFDDDQVEKVMRDRGLGRRQAQNHLYALLALNDVRMLRDEGNAFAAWILGDGEEKRVRWSVLAELGRFEDDYYDRRDAVEWVADHFLLGGERRVKDVVVQLRWLREWWYGDGERSNLSTASTMQLYRELERTVRDYRRRHSSLSREQAHEATRRLYDSVFLNYHDEWIKRY